MNAGRLIIMMAIIASAAGFALSSEMQRSRADGIVITHPKSLADQASHVAGVYAKARETFRRQLGVGPEEPVRVTLCATDREFKTVTGGSRMPETLGIAFPGRNLIVINCSRTDSSGYNSLAITVRHEVCHLVVGVIERSGGRRVPYWFNEGLAVYTSGRLPLPGSGLLPVYISSDIALPLKDIDRSFPTHPTALGIAYEQSADIVRFIAREYSPQAITNICTKMAQGRSFDDALMSATDLTVEQLERDWLASMGVTNTVISFVFRNFSLWVLCSLLAIAGFARYMVRRRRAMARWDREETVFPTD